MTMAEPIFDHDRLDVYRLSIDYVAASFKVAKDLNGLHRQARDQWLRAAQSIPLNIAEGNGKRSLKDRNRFLDIARGSAFECAAIQDVLEATGGIAEESHSTLKRILKRIVSMLTRLIARCDVARENSAEYNADGEYEYRPGAAGLSTSTRCKPKHNDARTIGAVEPQ
jgi:four helix bundle protein